MPVILAVFFIDAAALLNKYAFEKADFYPVYLCFCVGMLLGGLLMLPSQVRAKSAGRKAIRKLGLKLLPFFALVELANLGAEFTVKLKKVA